MGKIEKVDFRVKSTTWVAVVSSSWAEVVYRKKITSRIIHARIMLAKDNIGKFFCSFDPFDALYRSAKTIFEFGRVKKVFFDYENHHYTRTIKGHLMADSRVRVKNGQLCLAINPRPRSWYDPGTAHCLPTGRHA